MASRIKQVILGITIAIVLVFFLGFGINTFYKQPHYNDYCNQTYRPVETQQACESAGGKWNPIDLPKPENIEFRCIQIGDYNDTNQTLMCHPIDSSYTDSSYTGHCDVNYLCSNEYGIVRQKYNRNVFIIALILGLGALFSGQLFELENISSGIMGGGVLTMLYGIVRYWGEAQDWLRLILLGTALVILIWFGYKRLNPKTKWK